MKTFRRSILKTDDGVTLLPLFSFYYRTIHPTDCYIISAPHHPESQSYVKYLDEYGVEHTRFGFCEGPESPGVGSGCIEIIASSIVEESQVAECTP